MIRFFYYRKIKELLLKGKNKIEWIEKGCHMVAEHGFASVNIESISRAMNKSKSSFYNYFGDWEVFEELLLEHHFSEAKALANEAKTLKNITPDLIILFDKHKTNVFFHKHLRVHRDKPAYRKCFESVYNLFEDAILEQWCKFLQLENRSFLAAKTLKLLSENFFLQITFKTYNQKWLKQYLAEVSKLFLDLNTDKK